MELSSLTVTDVLLVWLGLWSLVGFAVMGEDKSLARDRGGRRRISERALHELALVGGFPGIILGAEFFHHKTLKMSFWPPVVGSALLWVAMVALLARSGILPP
jgi:uncharacterized membrane protein YsdA (DUF1294 family)